jgi:hypothetical protein
VIDPWTNPNRQRRWRRDEEAAAPPLPRRWVSRRGRTAAYIRYPSLCDSGHGGEEKGACSGSSYGSWPVGMCSCAGISALYQTVPGFCPPPASEVGADGGEAGYPPASSVALWLFPLSTLLLLAAVEAWRSRLEVGGVFVRAFCSRGASLRRSLAACLVIAPDFKALVLSLCHCSAPFVGSSLCVTTKWFVPVCVLQANAEASSSI